MNCIITCIIILAVVIWGYCALHGKCPEHRLQYETTWFESRYETKSLCVPISMFKTGEHYDGCEQLSYVGPDVTFNGLTPDMPLTTNHATLSTNHDVTVPQPPKPCGFCGNKEGHCNAVTHDSEATHGVDILHAIKSFMYKPVKKLPLATLISTAFS